MTLCACGCGEELVPKPYWKYRSEEVKYILGHQLRGNPIPHLSKGVFNHTEESKLKMSRSGLERFRHVPGTRKGVPVSEETRLKMSLAKKGKYIPWNKGKPQSETHRLNNSLSHIGHVASEESKIKNGLKHKGRHQSKEAVIKQKLGLKKYWDNLSHKDWEKRIEKTCSSVKRVSKNQMKLYTFLKQYFPDIILEHRVAKVVRGYYILDMVIFKNKIDFEYDSIRWHTSERHVDRDKIRDDYLRNMGWTVVRISEKGLNAFLLEVSNANLVTIGAPRTEIYSSLVCSMASCIQ